MSKQTNTNFILYGKHLNSLIHKGLQIEFNYDSYNKAYGYLLIKGIVTDLDNPEEIRELLDGQSILVKTPDIHYILENINLLKSSISTCDKYIYLCFRGNVIEE